MKAPTVTRAFGSKLPGKEFTVPLPIVLLPGPRGRIYYTNKSDIERYPAVTAWTLTAHIKPDCWYASATGKLYPLWSAKTIEKFIASRDAEKVA